MSATREMASSGQLSSQVWEEEQRFENPHVHYVDMSPRMYELKMSMLDKARG